MTAPEPTDTAALIEAHEFRLSISAPNVCACGWEDGYVPDAHAAHRAHLAAIARRTDLKETQP